MSVPSHAGDGAAEATWPRRRVMLAMTLPRQLGHNTMSMPSHASDGDAKATWPWRDVAADDQANMASGQITM
jgi:hypothetical protein